MTQRPLLSRILRQVQRATCKFGKPEATHPGLPSAIGREMLVEVGSAVFDDQRLSEWLAGSGGGPRVHEVHERLHVADAWCHEKPIAVASSARCVTRTLHSGPNPHRAVAPFTGSTSHSPAVLRRRPDRVTERAVGRHRREGHTLPLTSDPHPAVVHGHSPREDRKIRRARAQMHGRAPSCRDAARRRRQRGPPSSRQWRRRHCSGFRAVVRAMV